LALGEKTYVKGGDDAEVVAAATEGVGKVRVGSGVCVDDFAGGEYDLEIGWKWGWERIRRGNIP
jgi:hypothetical protein